jgi:colanic acid/amylovoran biosynthesis glycosyltransferase
MKVAFVVGRFPAVSQTFVLNQITGLIDRGVGVDVYSRYRDADRVRHAAVDAYGLRERTSYPRPAPAREALRRGRLAMLLARAFARSGGSPDRLVRLMRHGRTDGSRALGFSHLAAGGTRDYDAILCHFGSEGLLGSALRNVGLLRGPLLTAFHGYDLSRSLSEAGSDMYARLFVEGDRFLPVTDFWKAKLVELGCPPGKIVVHRMGVDCRRFTWAPRALPATGPVRLVTVARLVEKKGVEYAIRAVAACARAGMDVEYVIVGTGPLQPELAALASTLGVAERITLVGAKSQEDVAALLRESHILLAPSVTAADGNMEGLPVALMEALATGIPVVSTQHSGIPELVEDGVTGLLVPERDVDALAAALRRLASDRELYLRVSREGRRRVEAEFDVDALNDRLVEILRGAAAARPRAAA